MAPKVSFRFEVSVDNPGMIPELEERVKDLRPVFEDIIKKWARNNQEKFDASIGSEDGGAQIDPTVFWQGLEESTIKSKRRQGFPNQIMVATGQLEAVLEDEERFFHEETAQQVAFGTPKALEDELKVIYNWFKRPTIFLGLSDQKMIEADIKNYFSFGENWKEIMFARGLSNVRQKNEVAQMDMEFNDAINVEA